MNRLFDELFKEFPGGILGVCETIWRLSGAVFGECFGPILGGKTYQKHQKTTTTTPTTTPTTTLSPPKGVVHHGGPYDLYQRN